MTAPLVHRLRSLAQIGVLATVMGCTAAVVTNKFQGPGERGGSGKSINFAENQSYQTECGSSCHIGFLPGFLPQRSWIALMNDLEHHFGENAELDEPIRGQILVYLKAHAADSAQASKRSLKIARLIPASKTPLRITETPFWTRRHSSIRAWVFERKGVGSKAKCDACHRDAAKGLFDEHDVKVPKT